MKTKNWFEVDKEGLAKVLARKGKAFAAFELLSNAFDEPGVTTVNVMLQESITRRNRVALFVEDDAPQGFADISHSYTMFADSKKKCNAEQRGRFNLGEKLVFAIAESGHVISTTAAVKFDADGRHACKLRREKGSEVFALIRMTQDEMIEACAELKKLIPPAGITVIFNGVEIQTPECVGQFECALPTDVADADGNLTRTRRVTTVACYKATPDALAGIYEMGIPVCEIDGAIRFDVWQKIPLTIDRENVTEAFKRALATAAFNNLHDQLKGEAMQATWVKTAVESPDAAPEAVADFVKEKFGEKAVAYDPSDPEANKLATAAGYTVVSGGSLSSWAWANVKKANALPAAGAVTPSAKPYGDGPELKLCKEPTEAMLEVGFYARHVAREVIGVELSVRFAAEVTWPYAATYGQGQLTFNVGRLGKAWFSLGGNRQAIDALLLHEFSHHYESDHLSDKFADAICDIGAKWLAWERAQRAQSA